MPTALRRRVFLARDAVRQGLLSADHIRGPAWQRILRGVYADAAIPVDHGIKTEAAALVIPPTAAITGVSAAWLWGARLASPQDPVDVVHPPIPRLRRTAGLRVRTSPVPASDTETLNGMRVTTPLRTAWELARRLNLVDAVTYCDVLAARRWFDAASLTDYLRQQSGRRGYRTVRQVFELVDGRSESPQESRLRVHMALAGLPRPVLQYEVRVGSRFVARIDFAWPDHKVAVEYDGVWHADTSQFIRDRARLNRLQAAGWYVHHVTVRDMADIDRTVDEIRLILARRQPD